MSQGVRSDRTESFHESLTEQCEYDSHDRSQAPLTNEPNGEDA